MDGLRFFTLKLLIVILPFALISCIKDTNPTEPESGSLPSVNVRNLEFSQLETQKQFAISPFNGATEWSITDNQPWISVSPVSGITSTEEVITVTVDRTGLEDGTYNGLITISVSAGYELTVTVEMIVFNPILWVSTTSLDFGTRDIIKNFTIRNSGGGLLIWELSDDSDWLFASPSSGSIQSDSTVIPVRVSRVLLSEGSYSGIINITSNGGSTQIPVAVTIGECLWTYSITNNADLDAVWDCWDDNDDFVSGTDYWGVVNSSPPGGDKAVWCAGRGDHTAGYYANNMEAWMALKSDHAVDLQDYTEITIRFWMAYETEDDFDFVKLLIHAVNNVWIYEENTQWSGSDYTWKLYSIPIPVYFLPASNNLRFGFLFESDVSNYERGVLISDIEVWGR